MLPHTCCRTHRVPPSWFPVDSTPMDEVAAVGLELGDIVLFELVGSEMTVTNKFEMAHSGPALTLLFIVKTPPGYPRTHINCTQQYVLEHHTYS